MAYACECLQQHDAAARQAEGLSIVGPALSLSFMAAIVALAFVACAGSLVGRIMKAAAGGWSAMAVDAGLWPPRRLLADARLRRAREAAMAAFAKS